MKAIQLKSFGSTDNLFIGDYATPQPSAHQVLVRIHATALNRADIMQRKGNYPPPKGASPILGLEMAGEVVAIGSNVSKWKVGDRVCGLLAGGGYAEYCVIDENMAMPIPTGYTYEKAAGLPEVFLTAYQAMFLLSDLQPKERFLIHAGASGVGTAAIQLAKLIDCEIFVTASAGKHETCLQLGAHHAIDYKSENFAERVLDITKGAGVNVIVDFIAAPYFNDNIKSLGFDGRMVLLAVMGGFRTEVNLLPLFLKRLKIMGSTLRARTLDYKIDLVNRFQAFAATPLEAGTIQPIIDSVFDWTEVAAAHQYMEANKNKGKIILKVV